MYTRDSMGDVIRRLRREKNLTQEELGAYLGVSFQAVSKWENGQGMPDISQIVPLANFFGVSTDTLFQYCSEDKKRELEAYREQSMQLRNRGKAEENVLLWRAAAEKYPGNAECLMELADALFAKACHAADSAEKEELSAECLAICNRIPLTCSDVAILGRANALAVYLYSSPWLSFADEEKAVALAKSAGSMWNCTEMLLDHAYFTEENEAKGLSNQEQNLLHFMDYICRYLWSQSDKPAEERILCCQTALSLWNTLIPDGNFLFYHCRVADLYKTAAKAYAECGKKEETLDALQRAKFHCLRYDAEKDGEKRFTCLWLSHATSNPATTSKNYTDSEFERFRQTLRADCVAFIRNEAAFGDLLREE